MRIVEPVRVERSYVQKLRGKPGTIFPLLCPVRETEWAEGWEPLAVFTKSGFAEVDCVFTTGDKNPDSIWVMTRFDSENHRLEIVKVTPDMTVARISIELTENETGETDAQVRYMYTAISAEGENFVRGYSEEFFKMFMEFSEGQVQTWPGTDSHRQKAR